VQGGSTPRLGGRAGMGQWVSLPDGYDRIFIFHWMAGTGSRKLKGLPKSIIEVNHRWSGI
jgi:hypothetical protein